jgi:hypothetical protein
MAVLPTPASPMSTGLFLVRRERIWITRRISCIASDDRVQFAFARQLGQVAGVFFQGAIARLGLRVGDALTAAQLLNGIIDAFTCQASTFQDACSGCVALAQDGQEDVLGGDVFVFQAVGFFVGQVNDALDARRDEDLPGSAAENAGALGLVRKVWHPAVQQGLLRRSFKFSKI